MLGLFPSMQQQEYISFLGRSSNLLDLLPCPWVGEVSRELLGTERALQYCKIIINILLTAN